MSEGDEEHSIKTMEDFDKLKDQFAKKLITEKKDLTIADVMVLIQPLAAEVVINEP